MKLWALVLNGTVRNVIVSDADYINTYVEQAQPAGTAAVEVTDLAPRPGPGWRFDEKSPSFFPPASDA